jgi:hypothetical protein
MPKRKQSCRCGSIDLKNERRRHGNVMFNSKMCRDIPLIHELKHSKMQHFKSCIDIHPMIMSNLYFMYIYIKLPYIKFA